MLPVAEEIAERLAEQPVEIAEPVEPFGMHDHAEPVVRQEWPAFFRRLHVIAVDRDDDLEIAKRLLLQRTQRLADLAHAFVDRHSDRYAPRHHFSWGFSLPSQMRMAHWSAK